MVMVTSLTEGIVHLSVLSLPILSKTIEFFDFLSEISSLLLMIVSAAPVIV
jgi:hypothetical protein